MAEFMNTVEIVGDDALVDSIIQKTITEFKDKVVRTIGSYAFYSCAALEDVDLPNTTTIMGRAFDGCTALRKINIPSATELSGNCFTNCKSLTLVDFPVLANMPGILHFNGCAMLHTVILRNASSVVTLRHVNTFSNTPIENGLGYIYVPRALIESYKVATNWTNYASVLRVIEDYSVDGTVTGEIPVYSVYNTPTVLLTSASKGGIRGESYQTSIETPKGYILDSLSVIMNGVDVTSDVYDSEAGIINIPSVTGDIYVSAVNIPNPEL